MHIYLVQHKVTRKSYVGQTVRGVSQRWSQHCYQARTGECGHLHRAIKKEGPDAFVVIELMQCKSHQELDFWEQFLITAFRCREKQYGYNLRAGGESGGRHSEESKRRQSEAMKGRPSKMRGIPKSEETKAKIRASLLGRKQPPEVVAKRNAALRGKKRGEEIKAKMRGRKCTPDQIENMRKPHGPMSEATKEKLRIANLGKKYSEETKMKLRNYHATDETRAKLSLAGYARWERVRAKNDNGGVSCR